MIRERFVPLMNGCQLMADSHLMPLLAQLFENAATVLLEFAEKAQSNVAQQGFFEAMRAIRDHRPAMENAFFAELQRQFREVTPARENGGPVEHQGPDEDILALALVEQDALEEGLALQTMVAKAQTKYAHEIWGLRQRLALIVGGRRLEEEEIPGGPHQLAEAFRIAARVLPLEPRTKLVVFILFDRFVMGQLADLYKEYNSRLIQAGLLPHLKYKIASVPGGVEPGAPGPKDAAGDGSNADDRPAEAQTDGQSPTVAQETFEAICQLLSGRRHVPSHRSQRHAAGNPVPQPVLVSAIHRLQRADLGPNQGGKPQRDELVPNVQLDAELIDQIKSTLTHQRDRLYAGVDRNRVEEVDANIIDLVGLVFEYMLNDEDLPNAVKALLSHLHTPFLKVAILDKEFFTKESHPARQLFNAMIDAGTRYVVEADLKRGIFPHLQVLVNRIRKEFKDTLGLFDVLLVELQTRMQQIRNIAEATERRAREAASGQEKLERARLRAAEVVRACIQGRPVPLPIVRLLQQSVSDKLASILLRDREGEKGAVWRRALRLVEDIVASTLVPATDAALADRRRRLPELQARMRADLEMLAKFGAADAAPVYEQIAASQQAALSSAPGQRSQDPAPLSAGHEPVTTATQVAPNADAAPPISPAERRIMRQLEETDFGTWFDFIPGGGEPRRRVKLAWYTPMADRYMFVDGMGVQAAVLSRRDVARQMVAGKACISAPEKRPFLDRALEAVRHLLGGGERATANASIG